jgi:trans-o-hydroxybenzylidenepyruvate hydratase-aldolase
MSRRKERYSVLTATDLRGLYAIIPTPAKPGADRMDAFDTVNLQETERLVNRLIDDGTNGLIALGTTGECATVTPNEYDGFVQCVLRTVAKRIPTFIGCTALGAHEAVRRIGLAQQLGADGILLGMPMWQPCTPDMAVEYYRAISEIFPQMPIMVYANARAFRFNFSEPSFWGRVVDAAPTVMSAKFSNPKVLAALQEASRGKVHFLPIDESVLAFAKIAPESTTACWATAASMGPAPSLAVINAILAKDWKRAEEIAADISWASAPIEELVANAERFASYNIQCEKIRINAAGYTDCGPVRPPYNVVPDDIRRDSEECGRRWKEISAKYAALAAV